MCSQGRVFVYQLLTLYRMKPEHKKLIVRELRNQGKQVLFVGDPVYDVKAFRVATASASIQNPVFTKASGTDLMKNEAVFVNSSICIMKGRFAAILDVMQQSQRAIENMAKVSEFVYFFPCLMLSLSLCALWVLVLRSDGLKEFLFLSGLLSSCLAVDALHNHWIPKIFASETLAINPESSLVRLKEPINGKMIIPILVRTMLFSLPMILWMLNSISYDEHPFSLCFWVIMASSMLSVWSIRIARSNVVIKEIFQTWAFFGWFLECIVLNLFFTVFHQSFGLTLFYSDIFFGYSIPVTVIAIQAYFQTIILTSNRVTRLERRRLNTISTSNENQNEYEA